MPGQEGQQLQEFAASSFNLGGARPFGSTCDSICRIID